MRDEQRGDTPDGRCVNCNDCAIARACPSGAWLRVPADEPHPFRKLAGDEGGDGH